jgi:dTDP-glucose pyrophosphorylase
MTTITVNGREVVLVEDESQRILGLVTDGDIRRGLLAGLTLESSVSHVMTTEFFAVDPGADRAHVLDVMKSRSFQHVPVLDGDRRLVAMHFLRDLIGAAAKPNVAVVMAGGKGTRLRPFTEHLPKPMLEVAGRPMLERIILHLVGHGIHRIYLAVNYMAEVIERHFCNGADFGCRIEYLRETMPLGTGGALGLLPETPSHPFFVLNGDLVTRVDLSSMLELHVRNRYAATIAIGPYQVQVPFGTVTGKAGQLVALEEKPVVNFQVSRGIYVLEPSILEHVPQGQEFQMTALFESLLKAKRPVGLFDFEDSWLDVGRPEDLRRAQGWA